MSTEPPGKNTGGTGLLESAKRFSATLLAMGQTRLELLSTELEEERAWLSAMMRWALAALFFAALAVVLAAMLVIVIFWDSYRVQAISAMVVLFALGAAIAWRSVCKMNHSKPRLFSSSIAELAKDREHLSTRDE